MVTIGTISTIGWIDLDGPEQSFGTIGPSGQDLRALGRQEGLGLQGFDLMIGILRGTICFGSDK
jgi:hypothetical protein